MQLLVGSFNPAAAEGLMCRDTLSVGWDGRCALGFLQLHCNCRPSHSRLDCTPAAAWRPPRPPPSASSLPH